MSLTNRISNPTKEWVAGLGAYPGDVHNCIKEAEKARIELSTMPTKPTSKFDNDPAKIRQYADEIEKWNGDTRKMEVGYNEKIDAAIVGFIQDEAGLNSVPEQYRLKVFGYAWDKGHAYGYYEVYNKLVSLIDIFI